VESSVKKKSKAYQYAEAEDWCNKHKKGVAACLAANPHLDAVKRTTLCKRLGGRAKTGQEATFKLPKIQTEQNSSPLSLKVTLSIIFISSTNSRLTHITLLPLFG